MFVMKSSIVRTTH